MNGPGELMGADAQLMRASLLRLLGALVADVRSSSVLRDFSLSVALSQDNH
jgi:hypothetical protein